MLAWAQPVKCAQAIVLLILFVLTGCARPVRVGMSGDYPPFAYRDPGGCLRGYDVAMAGAWAVDQDRILSVVPFQWPALAGDLEAGAFDLAMSGITVRGDRLIQSPMTRAVATADAIVVARMDDKALRLDVPGVRVAVNRGGHLEQVARRKLPRAELVLVDDNRSLPDLLTGGQVAAVVTDTLEIRSFTPSPRVVRVLQSDRKAYWVRRGESTLLDSMDAWLAGQEATGALAARRARYIDGPESHLSPAEQRLADLVARRLQVMPYVAATKASRTLPVEDPGREQLIRDRAMRAARDSGLDVDSYVALVEAQFTAAKAVQRAYLAGDNRGLRIFALREEIRPAIDRIDRALREELALHPGNLRAAALLERIEQWAPLPGVTRATLAPVVDALLKVSVAAH